MGSVGPTDQDLRRRVDAHTTPPESAEDHTNAAGVTPGSWWTSERYGLVGLALIVLGLVLSFDGGVPVVGPVLLAAGAASGLVAAVATGVRLGIREARERP